MTTTNLSRVRLAEPCPNPNNEADQRIVDYRADYSVGDGEQSVLSITRSDDGVFALKGSVFTVYSDGETSWVVAPAAVAKPDGLGGVVSGLALEAQSTPAQSAQTPVPPRHGNHPHRGGKR